jgi:hypothetical protein
MATVKKASGALRAFGKKLHQTTAKPPQKKAPAKLEANDSAAPQQLELDRSVQIAVRLAPELVQRMRDAAYFTPGETLTSIVERGATAEIDRLERERGEAFPRATAPVRRGRPVRRG